MNFIVPQYLIFTDGTLPLGRLRILYPFTKRICSKGALLLPSSLTININENSCIFSHSFFP